MHVVHLYDGHEKVHAGRGSVPGVVWNIARETVRKGHRVTVVERQWDELPPTAEHEGVEFVRLNLRTGADEPWTRVPYEVATDPLQFTRLVGDRINFARRALSLLEYMDVDVLHVHLPFAANVVVSVAPGFRDRMVFTAHLGELRLDILEGDQRGDGGEGPDVPSIVKAFSPDVYLAKRASRTTVLNSAIADVLVDRGVPAESVRTVPNGVDTERFGDVDPAALERVRSTYDLGEKPTLLFVGTLMPRKGVTEFVRALDTVVNDYGRDVEVILAGEPELDTGYVETVESLVEEAALGSAVSMPGFVPAADLPALYHAADLFVVPSLEEGFGMTAIEAMAAGTPVVGTRVGALPDIIESGRTGTLADPGDVAGLADAIDDALTGVDSPDSAVRTRANEYSWPSVAEEFTSIYDEVAP
ncbi:glycosyltransferase [Halapricum sp. CBA1109]|uniref:glycosyltransferase family 4 protein n=1 Tax=Halapricum sp. CBA1109 TaxID=2668068 RepID=UPI0012FB31D5|nr:glycosyltransferase family 4 protein [Halapricum sp. CBA1109]MUV88604.1 glycosyltransferase [Halapricum sp. CBA1109]